VEAIEAIKEVKKVIYGEPEEKVFFELPALVRK
jgi:hypothetical protein